MLDFFDSILDLASDFIDEIVDWGSEFLSEVFDWISSWWNALFDEVTNITESGNEAVIIDANTEFGGNLYDHICEVCPTTTKMSAYGSDGKLVLNADPHSGNVTIEHLSSYQANSVGSYTDFDRDLQRQGGIMRLTN